MNCSHNERPMNQLYYPKRDRLLSARRRDRSINQLRGNYSRRRKRRVVRCGMGYRKDPLEGGGRAVLSCLGCQCQSNRGTWRVVYRYVVQGTSKNARGLTCNIHTRNPLSSTLLCIGRRYDPTYLYMPDNRSQVTRTETHAFLVFRMRLWNVRQSCNRTKATRHYQQVKGVAMIVAIGPDSIHTTILLRLGNHVEREASRCRQSTVLYQSAPAFAYTVDRYTLFLWTS